MPNKKVECEIFDVRMSLAQDGDPIVELKFSPDSCQQTPSERGIGHIIDFLVRIKEQPIDVELKDDKLTIGLSEAYVKANQKKVN